MGECDLEWNEFYPEGGHSADEDFAWEELPHTLDAGQFSSPARKPGAVSRAIGTSSAESDARPLDVAGSRPGEARLPTVKPGTKAARKRRKGAIKRANVLTDEAIRRVDEEWIAQRSRSPFSDRLKIALSWRGGLRASEIADLPIHAMLDSHGRVQDKIEVYASKTRTSRNVAMHDDVHDALLGLIEHHPDATHAAFSIGRDGMLRRQSASCVANWFHRVYRAVGLIGCSSHSGRRTFATQLARLIGANRGSIIDLQEILGHATLSSTQCYLEPSDTIALLVRSLGK